MEKLEELLRAEVKYCEQEKRDVPKYANLEIQNLLSNPHFIKSNATKIRHGNEIADSARALVIMFIETGALSASALSDLQKILPTIRTFVSEVYENDVPVWVNVGTIDDPVWLVESMCENYHLLNKSLKLYRYNFWTANAIYITSLFAHSHRNRVARKQLDIPEFRLDPTLAMGLKKLLKSKSRVCEVFSIS